MIGDHFRDRYQRFDGPGVTESEESAQQTGEMEQARTGLGESIWQ